MLVFLRIVSWMLIQISLIKSPRDLGSIDLGATWEPEISTHIAGFFDANKLGSYPQPEGSSVCAQQAPARLGFPGALPQRRVVWMWFGAFPGAFGLGRAQPQRRGTSP